jgi:hypothetical protein
VAVGAKAKAAYSTDGTSWTAVADTKFVDRYGAENDINGIAYGGGKFVAVGERGNAAQSPDGINWTATADTYSVFSGDDINGIAYGGGKFVAVNKMGRIAYADNQE